MTCSTSPATGPARAGNPPPAPAPPPTSARPPAGTAGTADDHRSPDHPGLIHDILDALERHGHYRSDDLHPDRAIGLIGDLGCIYEGTQDHPAIARPITVPSSRPADPGPSRHDTVTLNRTDTSTVLAALDIAADYNRGRAEMCADCPDQPCPTCETRLRDASAYDGMAGRLARAAEAARAASASRSVPDRRPQRVADREAGQ